MESNEGEDMDVGYLDIKGIMGAYEIQENKSIPKHLIQFLKGALHHSNIKESKHCDKKDRVVTSGELKPTITKNNTSLFKMK